MTPSNIRTPRELLTRMATDGLYGIRHTENTCIMYLYTYPVGLGEYAGQFHFSDLSELGGISHLLTHLLTHLAQPSRRCATRYRLADNLPEWLELLRVQSRLGDL